MREGARGREREKKRKKFFRATIPLCWSQLVFIVKLFIRFICQFEVIHSWLECQWNILDQHLKWLGQEWLMQ